MRILLLVIVSQPIKWSNSISITANERVQGTEFMVEYHSQDAAILSSAGYRFMRVPGLGLKIKVFSKEKVNLLG